MKKANKKGFTLVELLVVIAIIGILAAVIAPNAINAIEKAKVQKAINDVKSFKTAALNFYAEVGFFPADPSSPWSSDPGFAQKYCNNYSSTSLKALGFNNLNAYKTAVDKAWNGPYIDAPFTRKNPWGAQYDYECWGPGVARTVKDPNSNTNQILDGIYITIHGVTEKGAILLKELSPFEVAGYYNDDVVSGKKKIVLKISDWMR